MTIKCWECNRKLAYIENIGFIHPIKDKSNKCSVLDGIEVYEVSPEIRQYFLSKCKELSNKGLKNSLVSFITPIKAYLMRYFKRSSKKGINTLPK